MPRTSRLAQALAAAFLSGPWTTEQLVERGQLIVGGTLRARGLLERLVEAVLAEFGSNPPLPREALLGQFIARWRRLVKTSWQRGPAINVLRLPKPVRWAGTGPASAWPLPELGTAGELAEWLGVSIGDLMWFADLHGLETKVQTEALRNYRYRWIAKRSSTASDPSVANSGLNSSARKRLLEIPKPRLKMLQRKILDELVSLIPPQHAAHAFRRDRSLKTYLAPHAGQDVVLHIDLRDFFPSIRSSRITALFRTAGYPERVASLLSGLCTNTVPSRLFEGDVEVNRRYLQPHLPQGAPTSPALANLCAFGLDRRLTGLAKKFGATYTRYADDLVFSGSDRFVQRLPRFRVFAGAIALLEGFELQHRKTRVMRRGSRQQVSGLLLNAHPNTSRAEYDALRALLHNCKVHGPASQNRAGHPNFREHLQGRIAWIDQINPNRGEKLKALFAAICWE